MISGCDRLCASRVERGRDRGDSIAERDGAEARSAQAIGKRHRAAEAGGDIAVRILGRDDDIGRGARGEATGRRELGYRAVGNVGHVQVAGGVKEQVFGAGADPVEYVALADVLPGANTSTVSFP